LGNNLWLYAICKSRLSWLKLLEQFCLSTPEDMREIFAKNGDQGKEIGERLAQLLGFNIP